ncbi:MAG: hypothetical protein ABJJ37_06920 [Roseibium sp.]
MGGKDAKFAELGGCPRITIQDALSPEPCKLLSLEITGKLVTAEGMKLPEIRKITDF